MINDIFYNTALFIDKFLMPCERQLHTARFARLHEMTGLLTQDIDREGLLLGTGRFGRVLQVKSSPTHRELGNLFIVAPTRGGKGLLAVSQLLTWPHSVIVNDIKGELFTQTASYRQTLGRVYVIDPTGASNRYDPLKGKAQEDELLSSATNLLYKPNEGEGAIFTQRAIVMLTQLLLAARIEDYPILAFVRFMVRLGLFDAVKRLYEIEPSLATQFLDTDFKYFNPEDKFLLSAWGTLSARMRLLLTENIVRCFSGSDFSASEIMTSERPVTVYLKWPERDLLSLSPLVRLVWKSLIDELTFAYDSVSGRHCRPVLLLVDEAGRTAIPSLPEAATTINGRGISLWIAIQSLGQLDAVYGRVHARILRDNMDSQVFYRPCDQETAEYLQKCLGYQSGFARSESDHAGVLTSGRSEREIPLLTAQAIKQMTDTEVIVFHRNLPPCRARRMDWRQFERLRKRISLPVPVLQGSGQRPVMLIKESITSGRSQRDSYLIYKRN